MKLAVLASLALVIDLGNAAHAGCVDTPCTTDERTTTAPQAIDATLGSRIDDALKDLEIATARALKADQERMNARLRDGLARRGLAFNDIEAAPFRTRLSGFYTTWKERLGSRAWGLLEESAKLKG